MKRLSEWDDSLIGKEVELVEGEKSRGYGAPDRARAIVKCHYDEYNVEDGMNVEWIKSGQHCQSDGAYPISDFNLIEAVAAPVSISYSERAQQYCGDCAHYQFLRGGCSFKSGTTDQNDNCHNGQFTTAGV